MNTTWTGVPGTNIEINDDGTQFRWTFDIDGADFLATELHPDGTSREMYLAIVAAEERRWPSPTTPNGSASPS